MNGHSNHEEARALLPLKAAGCLSAVEEQRLANHLRSCAACAAELEILQLVAADLRCLPTPQPSPGLVVRTLAAAEAQILRQSEERWNRTVLAFLVVFAWVVTVLSWPIFRILTRGILGMFDVHFAQAWLSFGILTALVWLAGGAAAILLSVHQRRERRLA